MAIPLIRKFASFTHDPKLTCVIVEYTFVNAGDELPLHSHPDHGHSSYVVVGPIELFGENESRILNTGDNVPQYTPGKPHGFRALVAGAKLLNTGLPGAHLGN